MDRKINEFAESLRNIMREYSEEGCDLKRVEFESVTGILATCYIDISDSPLEIVRKFIDENPTEAIKFFSCQRAIDFFMRDFFYEGKSSFELIGLEGDSIKGNWRFSLRDQTEIMEEIKNIEDQGQIPTFVIYVSIFAA